jgi:hypothetical protein
MKRFVRGTIIVNQICTAESSPLQHLTLAVLSGRKVSQPGTSEYFGHAQYQPMKPPVWKAARKCAGKEKIISKTIDLIFKS